MGSQLRRLWKRSRARAAAAKQAACAEQGASTVNEALNELLRRMVCAQSLEEVTTWFEQELLARPDFRALGASAHSEILVVMTHSVVSSALNRDDIGAVALTRVPTHGLWYGEFPIGADGPGSVLYCEELDWGVVSIANGNPPDLDHLWFRLPGGVDVPQVGEMVSASLPLSFD